MEAIKSSKYYTEDLKNADIVYVNDYCYYIWCVLCVAIGAAPRRVNPPSGRRPHFGFDRAPVAGGWQKFTPRGATSRRRPATTCWRATAR